MESSWRKKARLVITDTLAALPQDAPLPVVLRALRAANPWPRNQGASWPAKCWYRERRSALLARFGRKAVKNAEAGEKTAIVYTLGPRFLGETDDPRLRLWLAVKCDWCGTDFKQETQSFACLLCGGHWAAVHAGLADPTFRALRQDAAKDPALVGVLRDWLAERGIEVTHDR